MVVRERGMICGLALPNNFLGKNVRQLITMTSQHDKINGNKSPFVEGESPLRVLRQLLGDISQEELARRLGVGVATISRWERGESVATFTIPQIKAFARELQSIGLGIDAIPDDLSSNWIATKKKGLNLRKQDKTLVSGGRR